MSANNSQAVADALRGIGAAYRGDWSDFDGRSLRGQLDELADKLMSAEPFDAAKWLLGEDVCPVVNCWSEHCSERIPLPADHPARANGRTFYGSGCVHTAGDA